LKRVLTAVFRIIMIGNIRKIRWLIFGVLLIAGFFIFKNIPVAWAATSTIRGAAWWGDEAQYLYFDCLDDYSGDRLDVSGNLYSYPIPRGFHFYSAPCTNYHKTSIGNDGNLFGVAWNYVNGYVSFEATSTPDTSAPPDNYAFNVNCPNSCTAGNNCWACYNETTQRLYGWGRAVDDGTWINLSSASPLPVHLQSWDYLNNSVLPGQGIEPGDFVGDAESSLGDLSFNCKSEGGVGNCAERDYKVYISNLRVGHLSAPNWSYSSACADTALRAVLRWYVSSGEQAGYEIVVNTVDDFDIGTNNYVCWSGVKTPSTATQYIIPNSDPGCPALDYNTNYYWWIRLYYLEGEDYYPTEWYQFGEVDGHNGALDERTDGDPDVNIKTFTTYRHEFPSPFFTWNPFEVLVGTTTEFTSDSSYYTDANPNISTACSGSFCSYLWSTNDAGADISDLTGATTSMIFYRATNTTVTLRVTDPDDYYCSQPIMLNINYGLPVWREVKAE